MCVCVELPYHKYSCVYSLVCCASASRCRSSALGVFRVRLFLNGPLVLLDALLSLHLLEAHRRLSLGIESVELQVLVVASFFSSSECRLILEHGGLVVGVAIRRNERKSKSMCVHW